MKYLLNRSIALLSVFAMMISFAAVSASAAGEEAVTGEAAYISADADVTAAAIQGEEPLVTEAAATEEYEAEIPAEAEEPVADEDEADDPETEGDSAYTWNQSGKNWYLFDGSGAKKTGLVTVSGELYYLDPGKDGAAASGWVLLGDDWYFFDTTTMTAARGASYIRGNYYFFDEDTCVMADSGLVTSKAGDKYYAQSSGRLLDGWKQVDGEWYYFGYSSRAALTGLWTIKSRKYYFNDDGVMQTGLIRVTDDSQSELYYFKDSGSAMTGWYQADNGDWYFFSASTYAALTGFHKVRSYYRYFHDDGVLASGDGEFTGDDGMTYYLSGDVAKVGWVKNADGTYSYYSKESGRRAQNSLWTLSNKKYYFDDNGIMAESRFQTFKGSTYCFGSNGAAMTGWVYYGGEYYYFANNSCEMLTGWQVIRGTCYYFYTEEDGKPTGMMAHDTVVDGYEINSDGAADVPAQDVMKMSAQYYASNTGYLFLVDTKTCHVGVFTGSQGNWEMMYYWSCTCGKTGHRTPTGVFTTDKKYYSFGSAYYTCYYGTRFLAKNGYEWLFHSLLYYPGTNTIKGVQLGQLASNGCVRLAIENARWIYNNIPNGTKVVIY